MQGLVERMLLRAKELLADGTVNRVLGWKKGEFSYDVSPAVFYNEAELENFVYNGFCGPNLCKYLVQETKKEGKILVFLKPCDTYGFNQLVKEHRINKDNVYAIGIECQGKLDIEKIYAKNVGFINTIGGDLSKVVINGNIEIDRNEVKLEKCLVCEKTHKAGDEFIVDNEKQAPSKDRFEMVAKLEAMSAEEKFAFWKNELSKCIRCNACRNVCPACTCTKCVFDNDESTIASKANANEFEEKLFHIIRAWHVAGRCTDCGECSRVCPQSIPLHLINRKFIKDMNEFYGEYQAGADTETKAPLNSYKTEDREPNEFDKEDK